VKTLTITSSALLKTCLIGCVLAAVAGCSGPDKQLPLIDKIAQLEEDKADLSKELERRQAQMEQLQKQMKVLSSLPADVKGENLYAIEAVKITRLTNLYDKDDDGKKDKLIVYIQPIDPDGDLIKAAGDVDVELWDLNNEAAEAKLGNWQVKNAELKKLWFAAVMGTSYRLTFDIGDKVKDATEPLTIKVAFADYLTGKIFKEQKVIKPLTN